MNIVQALNASGLVCLVGAGGKKTTMYTLAGRIERGVVTATVRIPIFDENVSRIVVTDNPVEALSDNQSWPLGLVRERERDDRYKGYDTSVVENLWEYSEAVDAMLVKADGARMRRFKAPNESEPMIPSNADTVIPVVSARIVGQNLSDEFVHRPERVSDITGLSEGEEISASDVANVVTSSRGGMKDIPMDAKAIPLVNMVDNDRLEKVATEIAESILHMSDVPRVVLSQMNSENPLVGVVE